ncbi:MAG: AraC-like DNA-binding protein/ligand-binding sensor protein [Verrucomicrobiales bacterium]|jgi:AraC-like DNA-binding protein/ligand-binding sensor protein
MNPSQTISLEERIIDRLSESSLYQTYRSAFQLATGLELQIYPATEEDAAPRGGYSGNRFCRMLNNSGGCDGCAMAQGCLFESSADRAKTIRCFAGLMESAVPLKAGSTLVGYLRIGQVFAKTPSEADFEPVAQQLLDQGHTERVVGKLRAAFLESPVLEADRYHACLTMIAAFALQLGDQLNRLLISEQKTDHPVVMKAKQYVNAHLEDRILLDEVAKHVFVSPFYFCKLFKQNTGMTLTEFVNRRRVEWAKRKLLNPQARVTEIAYDVGYQSLSQFNRCFLKYAGQSPTQYREGSEAKDSRRIAA